MPDVMVDHEKLTNFCTEVFKNLKVPERDAWITADNLVQADLRAIPSHGVARLMRYVSGIRNGIMIPDAKPKILREAPSTASVSAENGLGQPASYFAMNLAINKALKTGVGVATVCNSNHYGIAGYYSMMALKHDLIGISMTNSAPLAVPTFGKNMIIGTNPLSLVAPCKNSRPFVLDMATTVVPRGKLEVYGRLGKELPLGWAVDEKGVPSTDTKRILDNMTKTAGGGILPLGGAGETYSGHKGYGLSLMIDLLCGPLAGAAWGPYVVEDKGGKKTFINVGHFFAALNVENFTDLETFKKTMDEMLNGLRNSAKAEGEKRIYIHGEKEYEKEEEFKKNGTPLEEKVFAQLKKLAEDMGLKFEITK
jgi:LDH2 family malate/lactate/ureidoglycolate dehydrogenase